MDAAIEILGGIDLSGLFLRLRSNLNRDAALRPTQKF